MFNGKTIPSNQHTYRAIRKRDFSLLSLSPIVYWYVVFGHRRQALVLYHLPRHWESHGCILLPLRGTCTDSIEKGGLSL